MTALDCTAIHPSLDALPEAAVCNGFLPLPPLPVLRYIPNLIPASSENKGCGGLVSGDTGSPLQREGAVVDALNGKPRQILIVDDHQGMARSLAWLFREAGYQPATFHLGLEALEHVRVRACKPVAAIVDIHLPDISGLILSQQLRSELGPSTPIIVLSGDGSMEVLNALAHVGATYFFQKPVSSALLLERVKEMAGG